MSAATATATIQTPTQMFWDYVAEELNGKKWENLEYELKKVDPNQEGIPNRRFFWLKSERYGVTTMSAEELVLFAKILNVNPLKLIKEFRCGYNRLTQSDLNTLVASQGLVWDVVDHVA
jgi:hypothetical protein